MKEDILQYIWKFQYYNHSHLISTDGDAIEVLHTGSQNTNQGPDFLDAKIKIKETVWAGNIEVHVNSSHWNLHGHSGDKHFNNIILHVVWINDVVIKDSVGNSIPTIELQGRVSKLLLDKYRELLESGQFIPCEKLVSQVNELTLSSWKQRLVAERLLAKSEKVLHVFKETNSHWEETFWWLIAATFGLKINSDLFLKMAKSLPLTILAKHKSNLLQLESLLFGQTGLLAFETNEKYSLMLQKEYIFLQKKYGLTKVDGELNFLRMRPANFPTLRLAQLASLIHQSEHLFSKIKELYSIAEVKKLFSISANDYWHYHYTFGDSSFFKIKTLGNQMVDNIIINTIVPILFAYGLHHNDENYKEKSIRWLEELASEKNNITRGFEQLAFTNLNAADSQAFIQLKNEYCNKKRCLSCSIGNSILKKS